MSYTELGLKIVQCETFLYFVLGKIDIMNRLKISETKKRQFYTKFRLYVGVQIA